MCRKYKRPYRRPAVRLPLGSTLNEVDCMDLKEYLYNKIWSFYLFDSTSWYSAVHVFEIKEESIQNLRSIIWMPKTAGPK